MGGLYPIPSRWPEPGQEESDPDESDSKGTPDEIPVYWPDENTELPQNLPEESLFSRVRIATMETTTRCNLSCAHCYSGLGNKHKDLNLQTAMTAIDKLAEIGINHLVFSGGEPLLYPNLDRLITYSTLRGLTVGMRSNTLVITHETAISLADKNVLVFGVSLDGATPLTHNRLRGSGTFERAVKNVSYLVNAGMRVVIESVLCKINLDEALGMISLAEDLGANEINFSALAPIGRGKDLIDECIDHENWLDVNTKIYEASRNSNIAVTPSCVLLGECEACWKINVTHDGWVTPCYLSDLKVANVLEESPQEIEMTLCKTRNAALDSCHREIWLDNKLGYSYSALRFRLKNEYELMKTFCTTI